MRLFHILTRRLGTGKIKVTQKLLNRLRRETGWKHHPKPHGRKHHGFSRLLCASLEAVLALSICLVGGETVRAAQPDQAASATSGYSAAALFNQANTYARAGKTGMAILDYTRAQLLAPNDADIAANLHFVRETAGLPEATDNWFTRSLTYARPNSWAWLGSFGLVLAGVSMLLVRAQTQRRMAFTSLTVVGALLVATAICSAIITWPIVNDAVIIARDAPARTSPVLIAEPVFKLRDGETVTVRAEHKAFTLVQTSAGRSGWVARADLARVVPQSVNSAPFTH
jgi:hypothetical protein